MNSDLSQSQRQRVISKIKSEDLQLLVATDIAARGLDIAQLDLVINYSLHDQSETYIHRTGRTGRAGKKGRAISLIGPRDFGSFHYLTKTLSVEFTKLELPTDEEVADARLAHLYEILRTNEPKSDGRGSLSARKLLKDIGGIETPPEDLVDILARLCEFTIGHFVAEEAKSLDEEFEAANREKADSPGEERQWRIAAREGEITSVAIERKIPIATHAAALKRAGRPLATNRRRRVSFLLLLQAPLHPRSINLKSSACDCMLDKVRHRDSPMQCFSISLRASGKLTRGTFLASRSANTIATSMPPKQLLRNSSAHSMESILRGAQLPLEIAVKYESQRRPNNQQRRGGGGNSDRGRSNNNRGRGRNSGNRNQNNNRRDHNR
jgi:ATP-dependent RNA helicase DeaD